MTQTNREANLSLALIGNCAVNALSIYRRASSVLHALPCGPIFHALLTRARIAGRTMQ